VAGGPAISNFEESVGREIQGEKTRLILEVFGI
jgi:hypothetical protein